VDLAERLISLQSPEMEPNGEPEEWDGVMNIEIKNCNNIDLTNIALYENKLNIKFVSSGTWKSSIAKALLLGVEDDQNLLNELMPFKLRKENPENKRPEVSWADSLKKYHILQREVCQSVCFQAGRTAQQQLRYFHQNRCLQKERAGNRGSDTQYQTIVFRKSGIGNLGGHSQVNGRRFQVD